MSGMAQPVSGPGETAREIRRFADMDCLARTLAGEIAYDLGRAVATRGSASLIVPGGSTPGALFEALSHQAQDWPRVSVGLTDERWVPPGSPSSNETLVRDRLLRNAASDAHLVGLWQNVALPEQALALNDMQYGKLARPFDVVVLGMGGDGHVASLFPGDPDLASKLDPACPQLCVTGTAPVLPTERLSLSLAALAGCRRLVLMITGDEKLAVLRSRGDLPVHAVLAAAGEAVEVVWAP